MELIFIRDHEMVINKDVYVDLISKNKIKDQLQKHSSCSLGNGCNFRPYKQCVSNIYEELGLED